MLSKTDYRSTKTANKNTMKINLRFSTIHSLSETITINKQTWIKTKEILVFFSHKS